MTTAPAINPFAWVADPYAFIERLQDGGYRTKREVVIALPMLADPNRRTITADGVTLFNDGTLKINGRWWFDGASGPSIDTATNILGAMIHDALYYLLKYGGRKSFRRSQADKIFRKVLKAQGTNRIRRWYHWIAVRAAGWLFVSLVVALCIIASGCIRFDIEGDLHWQHRAQVNQYDMASNGVPEVIISGQLNGGSDTDIEPTIKAALTN